MLMSAAAGMNGAARVLVVVAHPDDAFFGLGAVIAWLRRRGVLVSALAFTRGEACASTPSAEGRMTTAAVAAFRPWALACATDALDLASQAPHDYPGGRLREVPLEERVRRVAEVGPVDVIIAFDESGVTGHPDHVAATEAAVALARESGAALYLWTLPEAVATELNARFGTCFRGRPSDDITLVLDVGPDRCCQREAIHCYQSRDSRLDVVRAQLELLGRREYLIESRSGTLVQPLFRQATGEYCSR